MSGVQDESGALTRSPAGGHNPWLITVVISIATFMEILDVAIANVSLQHIAGSLAASYDESTWVLTSYLVSNAIVLPISGWLANVIGRKRFYMTCVVMFTLSSILCGLAWNLNALIFFRILQGLAGGGLAPSEQSMLADLFPPAKRGLAFAIYGIAVVVAPTIGPTLGGFITDTYSWNWIFFINVPFGILSLVLVGLLVSDPPAIQQERIERLRNGLRVDIVGFLLVALGLGALEIILDRGQRDDWFSSGFIVVATITCAASLLALIPWELSRDDPIVDIRLLGRRQFGSCFLIMLVFGAVLIGSTQFIPQIMQTQFGYTATLAGLVLTPGGFATMCMLPPIGRLTNLVQPKFLLATGLVIIAVATWHLTSITPNVSYSWAAWARIYQALGLPFVFVTVTSASYYGLPKNKSNEASGLINVARNVGGSIGVSMSQTLLEQREQFHQTRLVDHLVPSNLAYQQTLSQLTQYFTTHGSSSYTAKQQALGWIGAQMLSQAALLSYIDVFWVFAVLAVGAVPLAFLLRKMPLGSENAAAA